MERIKLDTKDLVALVIDPKDKNYFHLAKVEESPLYIKGCKLTFADGSQETYKDGRKIKLFYRGPERSNNAETLSGFMELKRLFLNQRTERELREEYKKIFGIEFP